MLHWRFKDFNRQKMKLQKDCDVVKLIDLRGEVSYYNDDDGII